MFGFLSCHKCVFVGQVVWDVFLFSSNSSSFLMNWMEMQERKAYYWKAQPFLMMRVILLESAVSTRTAWHNIEMLRANQNIYFNHSLTCPPFENIKSNGQRQRWQRTEEQLRPCRVKHDLFLPASVELDVGIKETDDSSCGGVPAVYSGSDQALPLAVPHDLYQARVAFVYILVQVEFQLHWKRADKRDSSLSWHPNYL